MEEKKNIDKDINKIKGMDDRKGVCLLFDFLCYFSFCKSIDETIKLEK